MGNGKCTVSADPDGRPIVFWGEYSNMDNHTELLHEDYEEAFPASVVIIN